MASRRELLLKRRQILLKLLIQQRMHIARRRYNKKRWWVHPIWQRRRVEGQYNTLMTAMREHDHAYFHKFLRMSPGTFDYLVKLMMTSLRRMNLRRQCLSPAHRLAITLRFLATGDSYASIAFAFRIGISTAHFVIVDTCEKLWNILQPIYLPSPTTPIWEESAKNYGKMWNFPGCCGAVDGRHMLLQQPGKSGSKFHNYKGTNSIVLMAVVDPMYRFLAVDIGAFGSQSDGGIFKTSLIGQALEENKLGLPSPITLPRTTINTCHVLVGDEAFQLRPDFLRPFPGQGLDTIRRIFNYRLSRARRCSENAFGILAAKWRVFRRPLAVKPANADKVVQATVVLHNFLLKEESKLPRLQRLYCPPGYLDFLDSSGNLISGEWATEDQHSTLQRLHATSSRSFSCFAARVRDTYAKYFASVQGEVPWQWNLPGVSRQHV